MGSLSPYGFPYGFPLSYGNTLPPMGFPYIYLSYI